MSDDIQERKTFPICEKYWGSHGCDLPEGTHTLHECHVFNPDETTRICSTLDDISGEVTYTESLD